MIASRGNFEFASFLWLALASCCLASPQTDIQARYDRANQAMKFKYEDGVLAIRTTDFKAYDEKGHLLPARVEHRHLEAALATASTILERTTITHLVQKSATEVHVHIQDAMDLARPSKSTLHVATEADDVWVRAGGDWKLKASHVQRQTVR
ncbi:MAG TPA: hypothetical protein VGO93_31890 [Candidatus Xenobia bacterium]|jgi:hypothetical protein